MGTISTPRVILLDPVHLPESLFCLKKEEGFRAIKYQHLFRFKTGKVYEAMRYHFTSMAEEAEMDLAIVQIMCILYNRENNEKFNYTTYCVPPLFLHNILEKYGPDYIDTKTGLPYKIKTMLNLDVFDYIDENK
ncbi:hypothetical protein PIB30_097830 [Stylosanthes scabra]|uniref:Uncharacterized protein n=1 Tax=Stylosanthes scabra TaxID=79078 RepID=A0ABU6YVB2_9FABA|nr:hypothetical protein [Stylosanthes scabra]